MRCLAMANSQNQKIVEYKRKIQHIENKLDALLQHELELHDKIFSVPREERFDSPIVRAASTERGEVWRKKEELWNEMARLYKELGREEITDSRKMKIDKGYMEQYMREQRDFAYKSTNRRTRKKTTILDRAQSFVIKRK